MGAVDHLSLVCDPVEAENCSVDGERRKIVVRQILSEKSEEYQDFFQGLLDTLGEERHFTNESRAEPR